MAALFAALVALASGPAAPVPNALGSETAGAVVLAPLEAQATASLQRARQSLAAGERGRGLAMLDSLAMSAGVTVALESAHPQEGAVARGLEAWNSVLGERPFRALPAGSSADVVVRFVPTIDEGGGDAQGYVKARREMSWSPTSHSYRLRATIFVRDNVFGRRIAPNEITSVVAHEAGHLLGLADVPGTDRLMGPMVAGRPNLGPTEGEIAAVAEYRTLIRRSYPNSVDKR